jgi:hypothetical protein
MIKLILCAIFLLSFSVHAETKFGYTGDAYVRGYYKNSTGDTGTQAFNQFFRFNANVKPDDNLTVKAGLILSSNTWEGDNHKGILTGTTPTGGTAIGGTNDDGFSNDNVTRLDHAVIEYSKNNWITSVGRHAVSTPGNFLTSDDRRDRIQLLKIQSNYDVIAFAYDKRGEGSLSNANDDVDMYSLSYYGAFSTFKYAMQTGYWISKEYSAATTGFNALNLDNIKQISPQIEGKVGPIDMNFYYTVLFGGDVLYKNDHHASALKLAHTFDLLKVEVQSMVVKNGGLVAGGFDSLSSLINNSPDHSQSSIKLKTIGFGLGNLDADESLHMIRLSKAWNEELTTSLGGGFGEFFSSATTPLEKNKVLDASAKYAFSPNLKLEATVGRFYGDFKKHAGSLTLKANF